MRVYKRKGGEILRQRGRDTTTKGERYYDNSQKKLTYIRYIFLIRKYK